MPLQQTSGNVTADAYGGGVAVVPTYIEQIFSTYLYDGTSVANTITNGIDLAGKGGLVWVKQRSNVFSHGLMDTARGLKYLSSDTTAAQGTLDGLVSYNNNGFTLNIYNLVNQSAQTYASWTFRKQPKFFDVVTYTGTGSARTIAHALGSVPGCMIVKQTSAASNWMVYHNGLTSAQYTMSLNTTAAQSAQVNVWNSTAPTSTVFTVGADLAVNDIGQTYVAYIFAHNAGGFGLTGTDNVISCGNFTPPFSGTSTVTLGYEPQYVLVKSTGTGNWYVFDNMRGFSVTDESYLWANSAQAETNFATNNIAPTATGFTISSGWLNSSFPAIYIAIRRGPMKVPTDGTKVFAPVTYSGDGSASRIITGASFPPDLSITKTRNSGNRPLWFDRLRGAYKIIQSNDTAAEFNDTSTVSSFNMNGISIGNTGETTFDMNYLGTNYIDWFFRRAPGFFDEVCYTGTGVAGLTVNHNLTVAPELIIIKKRSSASVSDWEVSHSLGATTYSRLFLNTADANFPGTPTYGVAGVPLYSKPTSTQLQFGANGYVNGTAATYVAYLFATCPGVSKVGSYTGNGTTQAIACGFAGGARFVLIKRTDSTGDWYTYDTARGMTTLTDPYLLMNSTAAEAATLGSVTTTTGGFTVNAAILAAINTNAASYIFWAVA